MSTPWHIFSLLLLFALAGAQSDGSSLWTSWIPLAVRSPYLNCWMNTTNIRFGTLADGTGRAPSIWPVFLDSNLTLGWAGHIRVDDFVYKWLGNAAQPAGMNGSTLTNIQITPTKTILNMTAGPIDITATFLSPIETADVISQSLAFSYLSLEVSSNDGQEHDVQVYSDISGEWLSAKRGTVNTMEWNTQVVTDTIYHELYLSNPVELSEDLSMANDDTVYYSMNTMNIGSNVTYMTDSDANCRGQFQRTGVLNNTSNSNVGPEPIYTNSNVFAIAVDLGRVSSPANPVVWGIGLTRNPAIGYLSSQNLNPYWSATLNAQAAIMRAIGDFPNALQRADDLDAKILGAASAISDHYADLVSLAARQAMAGAELTISPNGSSVSMFMRDTGASGRVSPVEGLYAAFPFFLYLNATYCAYLLEPILDFAASAQWTFPYAPRDLGTSYPNAIGDSASHDQGVEQSGNMLIMSLAYAQTTGDAAMLSKYYNIMKTWADYLVNNSLPLRGSEVSADTFVDVPDLTNLIIKGIIGIKAMSIISSALGFADDATHYTNVSTQYSSSWMAQALSSDKGHILESFADPDSSWSLTYNLFADRLLQTNVIPESLYTSQTSFFAQNIVPSGAGVPVYSNTQGQANSAWTLFAAAYVNDPNVRASLIDQIWSQVSSNTTDFGIFPTMYALQSGGTRVTASPSIGAIFAPLLNSTNVLASRTGPIAPFPTKHAASQTRKSSIIIASVVGSIAAFGVFLAVVALVFRCRRVRRRSASADPALEKVDPFPLEFPPPSTSGGSRRRPRRTRAIRIKGMQIRGMQSSQAPASTSTSEGARQRREDYRQIFGVLRDEVVGIVQRVEAILGARGMAEPPLLDPVDEQTPNDSTNVKSPPTAHTV